MRSLLYAGVVVLACAWAGSALAGAQQLSGGLTQATVGGTLTVSASLVDPGAYTMSLTDPQPARGAICATRMAGPTRAVRGRIKLTGKVPKTFACYGSDGSLITRIKITPGTYTVHLCQSTGPTSCNGDKTVIHSQVVVHLPKPQSR
jgi:hypothetical protein